MGAAPKITTREKFALHSLPTDDEGAVYGPFLDEPHGTSLGINFLGAAAKICSFNCVYCDLGKTEFRLYRLKNEIQLPSVEVIDRAITDAFKKIHTSGPVVDGITISGNGEPTLHPDFSELAGKLVAARDLWLPGKPIRLFTNGVGFDSRKTVDAANLLDERIVKVDAGGDRQFKAVNAPLSRTSLARVLNGVRKLTDVTIQSLFFEGTMTNTGAADIDEWLEVIAMIRPRAVHIYGLSRQPAVEGLVRCEQDTLYAIASRLERKTQIRATVIP